MSPSKPWPGDPGAFWAAAASGADPLPRRTPPDLTRFEDFERLAGWPKPGAGSAIIWLVFGVVYLGYAIVAFAIRPDPIEGAEGLWAAFEFAVRWHWVVALVAGVWALLHAPRVYRKDRSDHPKEVRDMYEAARDRGIVVETFPADFKVHGSGGWSSAVIGIDARLDPVTAARIRRAFKDWFAHLRTDSKTAHAVRDRNGERAVRSAADLFGPEAEGGYLIRHDYFRKRWMLLVPDPPNSSKRWEQLPIDESAAAES